jgi:hypothetical protein
MEEPREATREEILRIRERLELIPELAGDVVVTERVADILASLGRIEASREEILREASARVIERLNRWHPAGMDGPAIKRILISDLPAVIEDRL